MKVPTTLDEASIDLDDAAVRTLLRLLASTEAQAVNADAS